MIGFSSISDLMLTLVGKSLKFSLLTSFFTVLISIFSQFSSFISNYVFESPEAYFFIIFLLASDFITGIWYAIKSKTFKSSKIFRCFITMIVYTGVLAIATNAAEYSVMYFWMPAAVYGGMLAVLIVSIGENLVKLKFLPGKFWDKIKKKINI